SACASCMRRSSSIPLPAKTRWPRCMASLGSTTKRRGLPRARRGSAPVFERFTESAMPYVIGLVLSVGVAVFGWLSGFDRDRAFYATVLVVVASFYVLFAAMGGTAHTLLVESAGMIVFVIAAVAGFRSSAWIIVAGLAGHGLFDAVHGGLVA